MMLKRNSQDSTQLIRIKFLFSQDADNADHPFLDQQQITSVIINYMFFCSLLDRQHFRKKKSYHNHLGITTVKSAVG